MKETWTPWTIVHRHSGQPVLPLDCTDTFNPDDEALLVFRSEESALRGAEHQKHWDVDSVPMRLSDLIAAEASGQKPTTDGLTHTEDGNLHPTIAAKLAVRGQIYQAQGIGVETVGKIGPDSPPPPAR